MVMVSEGNERKISISLIDITHNRTPYLCLLCLLWSPGVSSVQAHPQEARPPTSVRARVATRET
jgi:hypothetical protein